MRINPMMNFQNFKEIENIAPKTDKEGRNFGELILSSINDVNRMQIQSDDMKRKMVTGEVDNLHQVMIVGEEANIALQTMMSIRGKVVEAYKEIMRLQI